MQDFKNEEYLRTEYLIKKRTLVDIGNEFKTSGKHVAYYISKYGLQKGTTSNLSLNENLLNWNNPIFNYLAGLLITDGYFDIKNHRFSLRVNNEGSFEVLSELADYFEMDSKVRIYTRSDNYKSGNDLTFRCNKLFEVFKQAGIEGLKNFRSFDYKFFQQLPRKCQSMFFRGVLDGDGNIKQNGNYRIAMLSADFIKNHLNFINEYFEVNYNVKLFSNSKYKHKYSGFELKKADSYRWLKFIYYKFPTLRFKDKYSRFQSISW